MRRLSLLLAPPSLALSIFSAAAQARSVTDLSGRTVILPEKIERVACLEVLCYPTLLLLGAQDRVRIMVETAAPWMLATNREVAGVAKTGVEADVEDLAARNIDIAFFYYSSQRMRPKLDSIGLPSLIAQPPGRPPQTEQDYARKAKAMIRLYGQALGGEAEPRAEDYCAYFDEKLAFVHARIAQIPWESRRRLFYVRGPRAQNTQSRGGYIYWLGVLAGAHMVVADSALAINGPANMEDILRWDPEVVIVGRQYSVDLVYDDPRWRGISAVRTGEVHPSPAGVFYWDGGPESILMMLFIAKTLYPALFPDLDIQAEIKSFYARFYRFALSDDQAREILLGQSPDGRRFTPVNN